MDYTEYGYNNYFSRRTLSNRDEIITKTSTDELIEAISGSKVTGGVIISANGKLTIDLENGKLVYNDGVVDLLSIGGEDNNLTIKDVNDTEIVTTS